MSSVPPPSEPLADTLRWWHDGEQRLAALVATVTDLDAPTLLPDWSRRTLLAHVARNADALGNLLRWARTGVESPMYASSDDRAAGIRESATQGDDALRADLAASAERLGRAADELTDQQWQAPVRTAQGRPVPAAEVPWMRTREVWVHAVDLDAGLSFADVPAEVAAALIEDVTAMWRRRDEDVDLAIVATDIERRWTVGRGTEEFAAPLAVVAAVLTGRQPAPDRSPLPAWL